ncbi:hypothetical protein [Mycolicibacterium fallax]|uniref:Uncharacterized protein n=1 Tax=Mycolicibacterium fallax TaxID=1793 RepID=A0A1X1QZ62_MYCFA|nr:hypothetical protein [Mycolicibacterium fallax]ORU96767.1 hypothetical protein AWC04_19565 [Mycolicibacterium fallax]BBY97874.1 hypothetical protein MFAL_13410 [Mycolicibacterium fallax]
MIRNLARTLLARRAPAPAAQPVFTVVAGGRVTDGVITVTVASSAGVGEMELRFAGGELVAGRLPGEGWRPATQQQAPAATTQEKKA